jgi:cytochrome c oxidase cbb3-type subunit 3
MANIDNTGSTHGARIDEATGVETVGHEWDGIEELNNPLPRWWLWSFYACIAFAIGYVVVYPAIPLLDRGTPGLWGWTSRGQLAEESALAEQQRAGVMARLAATPIEQLPRDPALMQAAVDGGRAAFRVNCVQCHGAGAAGVPGHYPNLNDDEWLWGGDLKAIERTIAHGIRQPSDDQTRSSLMPSFGRDGLLTAPQKDDVTSYVRTLSGLEKPDASSGRGAELFAANCAACHGPAGRGDRQFGAPNLTDAIWLYGASREAIGATLTNAHAGVMPAWAGKLDPATIRMLAAYVHSLGGGEDFAPTSPSTPKVATDAHR